MENTDTNISEHKLQLRNLTLEDYDDIKEIMELVYPASITPWTRDEFASQISKFPEGQICIEDKNKAVAVALSMITDYDEYRYPHTYQDIIGICIKFSG